MGGEVVQDRETTAYVPAAQAAEYVSSPLLLRLLPAILGRCVPLMSSMGRLPNP